MRTKLLLLAVATARLCLAEDLVLENDFASFVFSEANGFALSSVTDRRTGTVFRFDLTKDPSLWAMTPMRPEHNTLAKRQSAPSPNVSKARKPPACAILTYSSAFSGVMSPTAR